jgi:hypothetical protein
MRSEVVGNDVADISARRAIRARRGRAGGRSGGQDQIGPDVSEASVLVVKNTIIFPPNAEFTVSRALIL